MYCDDVQVFTRTKKLASVKFKEILTFLICEVFPTHSQQDYLFCTDNFGHVKSTDVPALAFYHEHKFSLNLYIFNFDFSFISKIILLCYLCVC